MKNKIKKILSSVLVLAVLSLPELQKQMGQLEDQIVKYENSIVQKQKQARTLKRDIAVIDDEISEAKLKIKKTNLAIQMTELAIEDKQVQIESLEQKVTQQKDILAEYIRTVNYYDQDSLLEILLREENLSDLLNRIEGLEALQKKLHKSLDNIRTNKDLTREEQIKLETQEEEQVALRKLQESQKRSLQKKEQDKKYILTKTKGQEAQYQKLLSQTETKLKKVKSQIRLLQSKGKQVLTLDEAIKLANNANKLTGVRSALILAILDQESDFNSFTGSCNYKEALRGSHATTKSIFEDICQELGLDPDKELVSCPLKNSKGKYVGSGGAMGPAQFMPRTWMTLQDDLESLLHRIPNPWLPEDAIIAMALYLKRNGALTNERRAAGAYFGRCTFYGVDYCDDVISLAKAYQKEVDKRA